MAETKSSSTLRKKVLKTSVAVDETVRVFSRHSPHFLFTPCLRDSPQKTQQLSQCITRSSPITALSRLPLELLHQICDYLDLQSLERLSRVSIHGRELVGSSLPFQELRRAVSSDALSILHGAGLRLQHSVSQLYSALVSLDCVSCGELGPFLHLLSAERCCYNCLLCNRYFWCMPVRHLAECFMLPESEMEKLPLLWDADIGPAALRKPANMAKNVALTSVAAAKRRSLMIYGSMEAITEKEYHQGGYGPPECRRRLYLKAAVDTKTKFEYRELPDTTMHQCAWHPYSISLRFPVIVENEVENGLWCLICDDYCENWDNGLRGTKYKPASRSAPSQCNLDLFYFRGRGRAWTKQGFLRHMYEWHANDVLITEEENTTDEEVADEKKH